ncbi:FeoB-associated Cys-rich membrane protein [Clostridium sp. MSJ-11]|uniref:FeoB-associated Cys-rich membrane protein n=1 Tax=Clostridium mobile TaxID=2841512 RepID=A0ABS6EK86_9CLOT|nr:FeoB-associated Cys-rich membrane protein [Clostridium mobile]MBU5484855.1 FeoB-associated Cys-rich membrane protein [Clostridium mobile]
MFPEIVITAVIAFSAIYILYRNIKKKSSGGCSCGSCSSNCPIYEDKNKDSV